MTTLDLDDLAVVLGGANCTPPDPQAARAAQVRAGRTGGMISGSTGGIVGGLIGGLLSARRARNDAAAAQAECSPTVPPPPAPQ
ncbi:MAG TPA: hypothetical protein VIV11_05225 [Kofleriaceae bacterium]